jgi:uncharacterized protein YdaU (DUF1376 family)
MMKNKAPAFQFYASDFITDTVEWSNEEIGIYIRLLCYQWINGDLPSQLDRLRKIVCDIANPIATQEDTIEKWSRVLSKFEETGDGRIVNRRLENVRENRLKFIESARNSGKIGAMKRWSDSKPYSENMALQSSSSSSNSIKYKRASKKKESLTREVVMEKINDGEFIFNLHESIKNIDESVTLDSIKESIMSFIDYCDSKNKWGDYKDLASTIRNWYRRAKKIAPQKYIGEKKSVMSMYMDNARKFDDMNFNFKPE